MLSGRKSILTESEWKLVERKYVAISNEIARRIRSSGAYAESVCDRAKDEFLRIALEQKRSGLLSERSINVRHLVQNAIRVESRRVTATLPSGEQLAASKPTRVDIDDILKAPIERIPSILKEFGVTRSRIADWSGVSEADLTRVFSLRAAPSPGLLRELRKLLHIHSRLINSIEYPLPAVDVSCSSSHIHGEGLFTPEDVNEGQIIGEMTGQIYVATDYDSTSCVELMDGSKLELSMPFRRMNHSCEPNSQYFQEFNYAMGSTVLWLESNCDICHGEEITVDYGWPESFCLDHCRCGSPASTGRLASGFLAG